MSRSNRPATQHPGWPAPEPADAPHGGIGFLRGRRGGQQSQEGNPQPSLAGQHQGHAHASDVYAPPNQPGYPEQPAGSPQAYPPPLFDPYAGAAAPADYQLHTHEPPRRGYAPPPAGGYAPPDLSLSQLAMRPPPPPQQRPSYSEPPAFAPRQPQDQWTQHQAAPDPRSYDPAGYVPPSPLPPQYPDVGAGWDVQGGYGPGGHHAPLEDGYGQGFDTDARAGEPRDDENDFEEEPRRRGGFVLVAVALLGAIAVGGGLAYAYKSYIAPDTNVAAPLIKGDTGPSKTKPSDPGGIAFPGQERKVLGKLGDTGSTSASGPDAPAGDETASDGTRKVQVLKVGRDGSILDSAESESAAPAVPGLQVVDALPPAPAIPEEAPPSTSAVSTQRPVVVRPPPASPKPEVIARAEPPPEKPEPVIEKSRAAEPAAAPPAKKVATVKKPPPPAAPAATLGDNGFVAVVASVPTSATSREQALKQYADMHQKYGSVLQGKTPDVRQVSIPEKGDYDRLLVGPPSSKEQAGTLCSELKAAGYTSCWVTPY